MNRDDVMKRRFQKRQNKYNDIIDNNNYPSRPLQVGKRYLFDDELLITIKKKTKIVEEKTYEYEIDTAEYLYLEGGSHRWWSGDFELKRFKHTWDKWNAPKKINDADYVKLLLTRQSHEV
jgi:hypothetical protein